MAPAGGSGGWTAAQGRMLLGVGTALVWYWRQDRYCDSNEVGARGCWKRTALRMYVVCVAGPGLGGATRCARERAANGALRGSRSDWQECETMTAASTLRPRTRKYALVRRRPSRALHKTCKRCGCPPPHQPPARAWRAWPAATGVSADLFLRLGFRSLWSGHAFLRSRYETRQ